MVDQGDTNATLWKSEEVARAFVGAEGQRERERQEQFLLVARVLPFDRTDAFTFIDLGAGTGAASRAVLNDCPRATAILAEFSPAMMAEGDKLLGPYTGRYRYVEFDMTSSDWPTEIPARVDAVISTLSIHHLPDDRKRSIFREIRDRLQPGGWYVNFDPVRAPEAALDAIWERINDRYDPDAPYKRTHRTPLEQARWENHVRYISPLGPQIDWLREAGFVDVDVFWKRLDWVIYGGHTPAAG